MKAKRMMRAAGHFVGAKFLGRRVPAAIGWEVTNRCHARCRYCGFANLPQAEMETDEALRLIDQMAAAKTVRVHLGGGEPMMRQDIGRLIDRLADHRIACALNTSGHQVDDRIEQIRRIDVLRLSYDGPEQVHDALRGEGAHRQMLQALDAAKRTGVRTVLNATINTHNVHHIDASLAFAQARQVPIKFQPIFPDLAFGSDIAQWILDRKALRGAIGRLRQSKKTNPWIVNSLPNLDYYLAHPQADPIPCMAGVVYTRIDPIGRLYPCSMMTDDTMRQNALELGLGEAFRRLPPVHCNDCLCPPTLELNFLYGLNWRSLWNLPRYL